MSSIFSVTLVSLASNIYILSIEKLKLLFNFVNNWPAGAQKLRYYDSIFFSVSDRHTRKKKITVLSLICPMNLAYWPGNTINKLRYTSSHKSLSGEATSNRKTIGSSLFPSMPASLTKKYLYDLLTRVHLL